VGGDIRESSGVSVMGRAGASSCLCRMHIMSSWEGVRGRKYKGKFWCFQ